MAKVSWPPLLAVGHQCCQVLLQSIVIQTLECLGVVEIFLRVGGGSVLSEDVELELIGPPVAVTGSTAGDVLLLDGAFSHVSVCFVCRGGSVVSGRKVGG